MIWTKWFAVAGLGQAYAAVSPGCSAGASVEVNKTLNVTLGGRYYLLFIPPNYSPGTPAPAVLSFHGANKDAEKQLELDLLTTPYFNVDHIVIYPNGLDGTWQGVPDVTTNDTEFVTNILDKVEQEYCIDQDRVYATGKSQGGGMVGVLACDRVLSTRIAAFAPVSGAFYVSNVSTCKPETVQIPCNAGRTDVPVLDFHGGADSVISIDGGSRKGGCLPSIRHWVQAWAARDSLGSTNTSTKLTDEATKYEFGTGETKGLVTFVFDGEDINHSWPYTGANSDNEAHGDGPASFNASSLILDFFQAHPL